MFRSWYATCPRGAEPALEAELAGLGAKGIRPGHGGVRFTGRREVALRACLDARTALRLLEPVADFPAGTAEELYAGARGLPWTELIAPGQTFAISASGSTPQLTHTHFVALKTKDAIADALRDARGERPDVDVGDPDVPVVVHLHDGGASVSLDLAGALLSDRGYRVRTVEAPLRESLAAAVVLLSGWDRTSPLVDPLCGSGTIAIEAALIGARLAPNVERKLACERWPRTRDEDARTLAALRDELHERGRAGRKSAPPIFASDRDADAVEATLANCRAAGVSELVRVRTADARSIEPLDPPGWIVTNPPYGERLEVGGRKPLKSFYHLLGQAFRTLRGHRAAILTGSDTFASAFGVRPAARPRVLWNGPIRTELHFYAFS